MLYHTISCTVALRTARCLLDSEGRLNPGLKHLRHLTLLPTTHHAELTLPAGWLERLVDALEPDTLRSLSSDFRLPQLAVDQARFSATQGMLSTRLVQLSPPKAYISDGYFKRDLRWYAKIMRGRRTAMIWLNEADQAVCPRRIMVHREGSEVASFEVVFEGSEANALSLITAQTLYELHDVCLKCPSGEDNPTAKIHCRCENGSALRTLCFRNAEFGACSELIRLLWNRKPSAPPANVVCVENVTTLVLQDCASCAVVLESLATNVAYLSLKILAIISSRESDPVEITMFEENLDKVLLKLKGLRKLIISTTTSIRQPTIAALAGHSESLTELYIDHHRALPHGRAEWRYGYSKESLWELCASCPRLEQLGLNFPNADVLGFGLILRPQARNLLQDFLQHIGAISGLPNLITLRVLGAPSMPLVGKLSDRAQMACHSFAVSILKGFHDAGQSAISVISIGCASTRPDRPATKPICYVVKNTKARIWCDKSRSLTMVNRDFVKYDEPRSEILNVQHDSQHALRFSKEV